MASLKLNRYSDADIREDHGLDGYYYELTDGKDYISISSSELNSIVGRLRWTHSKYTSLFEKFITEMINNGMKPEQAEKFRRKHKKVFAFYNKLVGREIISNWHENACDLLLELSCSCPRVLFDADNQQVGKELDEILRKYGRNREER